MGLKVQRFEELIIWQRGQDLAVDIYETFRDSRDFGFKDQITRAAVSVSNNIAEGFNRKSRIEFARFLDIARASANEVKSMSYLAFRLGYISEERQNHFLNCTENLSKMIYSFIQSLQPKS
jgi:four helix bundle protein